MPNSTVKKEEKWNYRINDTRSILVKGRNEKLHKLLAIDLSTGLPFTLETPENIDIGPINPEKECTATFSVYTSRKLEDVLPEYVEFLEELDVDQTMEDFLRMFWMYPTKVRFELTGIELSA